MHIDGNEIIFDDFKSAQDGKIGAYKFASLIENNLAYQNGGSGIMVFSSDNVTVRGNTVWRNNLDNKSNSSWRAELQNQKSDNVTWIDNVAVTDLSVNRNNTAIGNFSFKGDNNTNVVWRNNTTFNGRNGDNSVSTNFGNSAPVHRTTIWEKNPNLSLSDIKSMAGKI